ncbi:hypothetical protein LTR84_002903 [Exophiala bonariae]|uniref:Cation/H+ exchanger domain-containing protein n=1 Tax=Exophiala bonariae TaxID=1690606 RepID=A0AAV9NAC9_9EURO|nr:hypothetical protein LTR84_002903 [Exophiala bonariae]
MASPLHVTELNVITLFLSLFMVIFMLTSLFITQKVYLGPAPVAFIVGIVFGPRGVSLINPLSWDNVNIIILEISRIVLAVQSFGNAIELPKTYLERHWQSVAYIIGPVMIGGWLITTCFVKLMVPVLNWTQCLACSACFNAIDPVLAATVLSGNFGRRVPKHLRDMLRTEAAANGVTTTIVLELASYLLRYPYASKTVATKVFSITFAYQSIFGTFAGIIIGYVARISLRKAYRLNTIDRPSMLAFYLSIALLSTGFGTIIGVDEVNMAFFAGIGLDNDDWYERKTEQTFFSSAIDLVLNLSYFVLIGSVIPWQSFNSDTLCVIPWRLVVGVLCIFLFRRIPMLFLFKRLIPDIRTWREALFYGHFGPIGAGSIFSALLIRGNLSPGSRMVVDAVPTEPDTRQFLDQLWTIVTFVFVCSNIVHGTSIAIFTLGKRINTLTITLSYTQEDDRVASWMNRLPRNTSESTRMPRTDLSNWDEELEREVPQPGIPKLMLRRQREDDELSDHQPRRRRRSKSWPQVTERPTTSATAPTMSSVGHVYQIGNTIIVEDDDGEIIKTYNLPPSQSQESSGVFSRGFASMGLGAGTRLSTRDFIRQVQDLGLNSRMGPASAEAEAEAEGEGEAGPSTAMPGAYDIDDDEETPAEKRRRLAALGLSQRGDNDSGDDDDNFSRYAGPSNQVREVDVETTKAGSSTEPRGRSRKHVQFESDLYRA